MPIDPEKLAKLFRASTALVKQLREPDALKGLLLLGLIVVLGIVFIQGYRLGSGFLVMFFSFLVVTVMLSRMVEKLIRLDRRRRTRA